MYSELLKTEMCLLCVLSYINPQVSAPSKNEGDTYYLFFSHKTLLIGSCERGQHLLGGSTLAKFFLEFLNCAIKLEKRSSPLHIFTLFTWSANNCDHRLYREHVESQISLHTKIPKG